MPDLTSMGYILYFVLLWSGVDPMHDMYRGFRTQGAGPAENVLFVRGHDDATKRR